MSRDHTVTAQASLHGLPRELRLQIYQHVFALNLDCTILEAWKDEHTLAHGFRSVPELNPDARLVVPWVNLMLTCKDFAIELRSYMDEKAFLESEQNTTWSLDLEAKRGGMTLGYTTWRRIPCHPKDLRVLEASYNTKRGFQAWGDGGPHGITSGLYQTLNSVVHCGPRFDCTSLLEVPIHLAELKIKVESRDDPKKEYDGDHYMSLSDRETNPETTLYALGSIVGQIVNTGVLRGFVDMISVCSADKTLSWTPREVKGEGIPEYWNRYGFEWGEKAFSER
ncbi:hypothetical protein Slin15195_G052620 [Septoria linicola]|uniref:Uncharacterized protein n=1 Tax=Septoria linicola TaxID=215465 RepID=A0A9Q9ATN6_9PEZI|nr:hypothetical protein Slin15195_G052620 [Septoria linicola]